MKHGLIQLDDGRIILGISHYRDPRRSSNDGQYDFYPVLKEYADLGCKGCGEFVLKHTGKLMFGTDRFVREEDPEMIGVLRDMALPAGVEQAIFRGNAERMLGLKSSNGGQP